MKKTIFLLNVDNFAPEITALTYPLIERYAKKIGAGVHMITDRKFPSYPPVYEKMQIFDLGREMGNDWNIYIDSDALVHPDMFDVTEFIKKDTVCHNGSDMANNRWRYDGYFRRDGRHIGSCNWFAVASDWCLDLWHPLTIPYEVALEQIFPIQNELNTVITRDHLIDDYTLSRNIARFGLKFRTVIDIIKEQGGGNYFWHAYTVGIKEKVEMMKNLLCVWEVTDYEDPQISGWMHKNELLWLYRIAQEMKDIVEVGVWKGKGTHALASGCKGIVHSVDSFKFAPAKDYAGFSERFLIPFKGEHSDEIEKAFINNTKSFPNLELIKMDSVPAADKFADNSIDMVWLDAGHDYDSVMADIKTWLPKCRKIICGHDYDHEGVRKAVFDSHLLPTQPWENSRIWYAIKG
jgi:hypothetical protein